MCFLKPLTIEKINNRIVFLDNGKKAFYDKKIGKLKKGDKVIVYGNLIINKFKKN